MGMLMSALCDWVVQVSHNAELSPYKLDERGSLNIMVCMKNKNGGMSSDWLESMTQRWMRSMNVHLLLLTFEADDGPRTQSAFTILSTCS